jgi:hypothetical protein
LLLWKLVVTRFSVVLFKKLERLVYGVYFGQWSDWLSCDSLEEYECFFEYRPDVESIPSHNASFGLLYDKMEIVFYIR